MPGTCNDCGASFKGDIKAHVDDAHPGLPRFRFRAADGTNHIVCPSCGFDIENVAGGPNWGQAVAGIGAIVGGIVLAKIGGILARHV